MLDAPAPATHYKLCADVLGEGAYGTVIKAINVQTQQCFAVKRFKVKSQKVRTKPATRAKNSRRRRAPLTLLCAQMPPDQLREIQTLRTLQDKKHPNIVGFHGLVSDPRSRQASLLLELCEKTLAEVIKTAHRERACTAAAPGDGAGIGRLKTLAVACDVAAGLAHCHSWHIMHRDLKPQNVLLDASGRAKLCDFGMACNVAFERPLSPQMITLWYRAPEVLLGSEHYGTAVDVWALGCVVYEMCWLRAPFIASGEMKMLEQVFDALGVPSAVHDAPVQFEYARGASVVPGRIAQSGALAAILGQMLQLEPLARPAAQAVLAALSGLRTPEARTDTGGKRKRESLAAD